MTTKKTFVELVEFLEANKNKKVETILKDIYELTSSKQKSKNFIVNESGKVTHIFCYYHKKYEPLDQVDYGSKKNSPSGYNSMCKEGVNQWTKQQRVAKQKESELLAKLASKEISPDDIFEYQQQIENERHQIVPRSDGIGTDQPIETVVE